MYIKFILILFFLCLSSNNVFCEGQAKQADTSERLSPEAIKHAIEKAITNVEDKKAKAQEDLSADLKPKLDSAVKEWVASAMKKRRTEMNRLLHQSWDQISKFVSPVPYDYYLRGFEYPIIKSDILKTDSMVSPYKAYVKLTERLYIEGYHSSDASSIGQYLHTASRPVTIDLEYREEKFKVINAEYGNYSLDQGWPESQKRAASP